MSGKFFSGVTTALVTPFKKGELDTFSLKKLIKHQLEAGIQGFVVSGSTGEAATLNLEEKARLLDFVIGEVALQVPVLMGCGTFNTQETCDLLVRFSKLKPSGFLVVTPYYNRPPQRGLREHYCRIAETVRDPIVIYNVPSRTAVNLQPETFFEISDRFAHVVGIKEAAGDLSTIEKLVKMNSKGKSILSGDDGTFVDAMRRGASGVISVVSHVVPKECLRAATNFSEDDIQKVAAAAENLFVESNPIPVKWALHQMGIISSAEVRLPLVELDARFHESMKGILSSLGVM